MAVINHLAVTDPDSGEVTTYEIQDALHDQTAELLNHDPVIELKNSIVDHDQKGYNAETLSETLNSGTENNIYTRYLAKRQITGISANATNTGIIVETVNQTGAEQSQEIDFTGLDTETLTARVTANENSIASLNTRVTNAQTELNEHAGEIASAQADITQAKSDISANTSNIEKNTSDISTLKTAAQNQAEDITKNTNAINNIGKTIFPIGSVFISENGTSPSSFIGGTWEETDAIEQEKIMLLTINISAGVTSVSAESEINANVPNGYRFDHSIATATQGFISYSYISPQNTAAATIYTGEHGESGSIGLLVSYKKKLYTWKRTE